MLQVRGLRVARAGQTAVDGLDLHVDEGEAVALLGANGAGKTTALHAVSGLLAVAAGVVRFDGTDVTGWPAHRRARRGLAYVPAARHLFAGLSVDEHLRLGAWPQRPDPQRRRFVHDLFPRLGERRRQRAGTLSGGEQQMLAVARALMARPRLLVLDEPSTGLAPALVDELYAALAVLHRDGLSLLVAEQHLPVVLRLAARGYVLEHGRVRLAGPAAALRADPAVRAAYLGAP